MYKIIYNPFLIRNKRFFKLKNKFKIKTRIISPPPNITGSLHIGHAFNFIIQDFILNNLKLKKISISYILGIDHAGIAVQSILYKKYKILNSKKQFWNWKKKIKYIIYKQIKQFLVFGIKNNFRFTLDKGFNKSVNLSFVKLYNSNLIFNKTKILNWDFKIKTIISDLESIIFIKKIQLQNWKYILSYSKNIMWSNNWKLTNYIYISQINVKYYKYLYGVILDEELISLIKINKEKIISPITNLKLRVFLKIDLYDKYNYAKLAFKFKFKYEKKNILISYILEYLIKNNLNVNLIANNLFLFNYIKKNEIFLYNEKTNSVLLKKATNQWFLKLDKLINNKNKLLLKRLKFFPNKWKNVFFYWIKNLKLWCISRQLNWGHKLPILYWRKKTIIKDSYYKSIYYLLVNSKILYKNKKFEKNNFLNNLKENKYVLDTWFSSALWSITILGWPNKTKELRKYYSTGLILSGFDIIFFWIVKMILVSVFIIPKLLPFKYILIHPLVYDKYGKKMSKSKNNIINPIILINSYGVDVLKLFFLNINLNYQELKINIYNIIKCRNICTKLWNFSYFIKNFFLIKKICRNGFCNWILSSTYLRIKLLNSLFKFNIYNSIIELFNIINLDLTNYIYIYKNYKINLCFCLNKILSFIIINYNSILLTFYKKIENRIRNYYIFNSFYKYKFRRISLFFKILIIFLNKNSILTLSYKLYLKLNKNFNKFFIFLNIKKKLLILNKIKPKRFYFFVYYNRLLIIKRM